MIRMILFLIIVCAGIINSQTDTVLSGVYSWADLKEENGKLQILKGNTTDNEDLDVYAMSVKPGETFNNSNEKETLIIVKENSIRITLGDSSKILTPGSIALIMPDDKYEIKNEGNENSVVYVLLYKSKLPMDQERGKEFGGSFMMKWEDIEFMPHDRGGIRQYFNKPTAASKRFEMHVTTLNAGIKSHEPHTHRPAEIVLMIDGKAEMEIGDMVVKGTTGDIFFLGSDVPHAIKNTDNKPIMYFAFQWE